MASKCLHSLSDAILTPLLGRGYHLCPHFSVGKWAQGDSVVVEMVREVIKPLCHAVFSS